MLMFVLIGLSLVLVGVVGLQFTYLFYVERMYRARQRLTHALERKIEHLTVQLEVARQQLTEQDKLLKGAYTEMRDAQELWADVIEER